MSAVLGVSHICLTVTDIDAETARLEKNGWSCVFKEKELGMPAPKITFLRRNVHIHQNALLKGVQGISVELIRHHADPASAGTGFEVLLSPAGEPPQVHSITAPVRSLKEALPFWNALGFREEETAGNRTVLSFPSPIPAWSARIELRETGKSPEKKYLDDAGWTCLSFLTRNIQESLEALMKAGASESCEPFSITVGGKPVRLCLLRGPDMEIIELLEPEGKSRG
jgi:catechol 2,3-dioxygenase-like lactoylglutathione lyase family enzyme